MTRTKLIKYWAVVEYEPAYPKNSWRHVIAVRENHDDAIRIHKALEGTAVNFEVYKIEGLVE